MIELRDATVRRRGRVVLDIAELQLRRGEHVAILGPNGAGKSTLVGVLARDIRPVANDDGSAALLLHGRPRWDIFDARRLIGVVSENLQEAFERPISVRDAVLSGFFGSIGLYPHQAVTAGMRDRTGALLESLEIAHLAERSMDALSTGEGRRALIARALVHDPPFLVLDEPCDGLDPRAAFRFLSTLRSLADEGRTLALVTQHVDDIVPEIERVVILREGRVMLDGPVGEVLTTETLSQLYEVPVRIETREGWHRLWWDDAMPAGGSADRRP